MILRQFLDQRCHLRYVRHAVDTNGRENWGTTVYELQYALSKHVITVGCGNAEAEHDRQLRSDCAGSFDGDAGILHVENGFDEQGVYTTVCQSLNLFGIRLFK